MRVLPGCSRNLPAERGNMAMNLRKRLSGRQLAIWAGLCAMFVLSRALMVLPWLMIHLRNRSLMMILRFAATALIWVMCVLPEQRLHCWCIMRMHGDTKERYSYGKALKLELYRVLRILYAVLPAIVLGLLVYYIVDIGSFDAMRILKTVGSVFGKQRSYGYDTGLAALLGMLTLFGVLILMLWYRYTPNDYLGTIKPFRHVGVTRVTVRNFCLAFVAYALWGVILYIYLADELIGFEGLFRKVVHLKAAIRSVFKHRQFRVEMALVLVFLYCPLWCLRKNAAAREAAALR